MVAKGRAKRKRTDNGTSEDTPKKVVKPDDAVTSKTEKSAEAVNEIAKAEPSVEKKEVESTAPEEAAEKPAIKQLSAAFLKKFATPTDGWSCSSCMVNNKVSDSVCVACGAKNSKKSTSKAAEETVTAPTKQLSADFLKKFATSNDGWECSSCMVNNKSSDTVCMACGAKNPKKKDVPKSTKQEEAKPTITFGSISSETPKFSFGSSDPSAASFSFGSSTAATSVSGFTFGAATSSTASGISFGSSNSASTGFSFGSGAAVSSTGISFGAPSSTSAAAISFGAPSDAKTENSLASDKDVADSTSATSNASEKEAVTSSGTDDKPPVEDEDDS